MREFDRVDGMFRAWSAMKGQEIPLTKTCAEGKRSEDAHNIYFLAEQCLPPGTLRVQGPI